MKILFVTNVVPNPAGYGSARRAFMHLQALRRVGIVTVVVPPTDGKLLTDLAELRVIDRGHTLADIRHWMHEGTRSRLKRPLHALRRLNLVDGRAPPQSKDELRAQIGTEFDLIFAYRLHSAIWYESVFGRLSKAVRFADLDDIESVVFAKRIKEQSSPFWWRFKLRFELRWLRETERRIAASWNAISLCSQVDSNRFFEMTGAHPLIVPNCYVFGSTTPEPVGPSCRVLFVGTFGYFPNAEGVQWFVDEIWPRVKTDLGNDVELDLVGLDPTPAILSLGEHEGITVSGNVPSVAPYYEAANIVIAPLNAGSGTRIKLIEAAALGRAIVTTSLGCEGLGFVDGVHAEIADDPVDFAQRVIALARDPARRARLAEAARRHAVQAFSAEAVTASLEGHLRAMVQGGNTASVSSVRRDA